MSEQVIAGIRKTIRGVFGVVHIDERNRKAIEALVDAMFEGEVVDHDAVVQRFESVIEDLGTVRDTYRFRHEVGAVLAR